MSIVLDALNKAERDARQGAHDDGSINQKNMQRLQHQYRRKLLFIVVLNCIVVALVGGMIYLFQDEPETMSMGPDHEKESQTLDGESPLVSKSDKFEIDIPVVTEADSQRIENSSEPAEVLEVTLEKSYFAVSGMEPLKIDGIMEDQAGGAIMVGSDVYGVGDNFHELTIESISVSVVVIQYKGKKYEIPI